MKTNQSNPTDRPAQALGSTATAPAIPECPVGCWLTTLTALAVLFGTGLAQALPAVLNDGATHVVSDGIYGFSGVTVQNGTTLIIQTGAEFGAAPDNSGQVLVLDTSTLIITGGTFGNFPGSGNYAGAITALNNATVTITGGTFGGEGANSGELSLSDSTIVTITGGSFGGSGPHSGEILASGNSLLTITGGAFGRGVSSEAGAVHLASTPTVSFRGLSFDTTSYSAGAGGTLGVTFCSAAAQIIRVVFDNTGGTGTVNLMTSCGNVLAKNGTPQGDDGEDGFFLINALKGDLYGPKAGGIWPSSPLSLVGPQGQQGATGAKGDTGPAGIGLVPGAVIFLVSPSTTPAGGFIKIGTTKQTILDQEEKPKIKTFDVYEKQ